MMEMFYNATSFDQALGSWNITSLENPGVQGFLQGARLSNVNYDDLLLGWSSQVTSKFMSLDAGNSTYCDQVSHDIVDSAWVISSDGGPSSACSIPALVITSPTPDQIIDSSELTITGTATPGRTVRLRVDDQTFDLLVDESGQFTQAITGLTTNPYSIIATILVDSIDESPSAVLAFTVTEPSEPTSPTTPTPPATGVGPTSILPVLIPTLGLSGITLGLVTRRRRLTLG